MSSKGKTAVRRGVIAAAAVAATGAIAFGAAAPANADDDPAFDPCDLSTVFDELTDYGDDTSKNIMIYNAKSAASTPKFEGIVQQGSEDRLPCEDDAGVETFKWVVFTGKGEFDRAGDGGYRNWSFYGKWDRPNDHKVDFHAW